MPDSLDGSVWHPARKLTKDFCLSFSGLVAQVVVYAVAAGIGAWVVASPTTETTTKIIVAALSIALSFVVFVVVAFGVCTIIALRRQRDNARTQAAKHEEAWETRLKFRAECHEWCDQVRTLLDAQEAKAPKLPAAGRGALSLLFKQSQGLLTATDKTEMQRQEAQSAERERIEAETVSEYIRRFRGRGTELCEALLPFGVMNRDARARIHSPQRVGEISLGVAEIRDGSNQLCN